MYVNIAEAKTNLSRYLARVKVGETIVICERNIPIAELRPLSVSTTGRRSLEPLWPGWDVPETFFEPLPNDILKAFEGGSP
jgi:antitoxin (DNA-binding transcriptional repressor) of toxin-antitoxin stability system